mmetsp:Transcript_37656/g.80408  ORF Transcript_37656/g.80408 Transcript_37656/m.80408 type:complete len:112 (+) Transcript_37656:14-349(+)
MTPLSKAAGTAAAAVRGRGVGNGAFITRGDDIIAHRSPFSDSTNGTCDDEFGATWQPNQTTTLFRRMERTCPDVLKAYARCVVHKQNSGALFQGACEEQFRAVMDCFRSVR